MNKLVEILEKLIRDSKKTREWKSFIFCLSAIVVFTTTYALILPAITVEKSTTDSVGGLVVEEADPGSTGAGAEASEDVHTVGAKNEVPDETVQEEAAGNTAVDEEVREPVNGEVQTVGDKKIMTLTGEEFDVVVSADLSAGVSDGTVLSVRGIPEADVVKSFSDRISDELLKRFIDTKSTEILYRLVFTDRDFVEYTPTGYYDVEFIFHDNTVGSDGEMIYAPRFDGEKVYAAVYDYLTDEMILAEKNGDEYETPVSSLDEYGVITGITLKGLDFYEYSDIITLVGGPVNEELKRAAEKAESSAAAENGTESTAGKTESADAKTASAESKSEGASEKDKKSAESKEYKSGTLNTRGSDYSVKLVYSAEAEIPDKAVLDVTEIETGTSAYEKYLEQAKAAIGLDKDQVLPQEQARFFDIRIMADGKEVQPAANVNVSIAYDTPVVESDPRTDSQIDVSAVHFGKEGAEVVEVGDADDRSVKFEAESFSIYGVIYTVDFEYSVNGKMYQFSLPGGGFVSFANLVEVLGIIGDTNADENGDEIDATEAQAANGLLDVKADNAAKKFVADVVSVEFSSPELVDVSKVEADTTVGQIKENRGLEVEYSTDLTEEQIEEINAQTVEAGDWALISVQPFTSEETLTVTMKNGDRFVVRVTDAQISADDYDNVVYTYTVNDENAGTINLVNSSGNLSGQNNSGSIVTDGLNNARDKANRFARAVANNGYRFVRWTNEGKDYKNGANDIRPSKAELENGEYTSDTFVANFVANNDYLLTFQTTAGGRIKDNLTSLTYNQLINTAPDIFAIPDPGYRCLGWRDQYGQMVTTDRYLYSSNVERADGVYTAVFEKILDQNIYYRANGTYGTVSSEHEIVHGDDFPEGSVAVPHEGYQFISWVNDQGETVWPLEEFQPFADLIYDGATYTAVFESAAYSSYFMMQADDTSHGYIESPQYENSVNGRTVTMYIRDDGTVPASMKAVAYDEWLFDHWEVNGVEVEELGDTIPAGYDFSGFELRDGWNVLIAYYKENPAVPTHTITYKANTGGTVRGTANKKIGDDYVDEWTGTNASTVRGATATANTNWTFTGWLEIMEDGSYKVVSNDSNFIPSGDLLKDTTYYAAFRINESQKGMVGYNMNITDVTVKWNGVKDIVIASGAGAPMYYDTNNGNYFARGQKFSIDTTIPEADGYYFLGWYSKDRNKWTSTNSDNDNGNCPVGQGGHPKTSGDIIPRGSDTTLDGLKLTNIVFPMGGSGSRYTFEAMFAGIDADSKRVPYDGTEHQLIGVSELLKGTVGETERFRAQLARLEQNGGYRLDPVKYQLLDDNGNAVGEPTDSFTRTMPGVYKVRVYSDGIFAGQTFRIYKDVTLEIFAAKVIIKKYWLDDSYSVRPDDLEVNVYKYDTKNKGAVNNPDTNVNNRNQARQRSENITQTADTAGTNVASILAGYTREEPEWQKHGGVWTIEYDDVLVRNLGYSETDQSSGYDLFFADEVKPEGYNQIWTNWERSDDKLTTTITFRNEYLYEPITLTASKEWVDGTTTAGHPAVTFYLLRSVNGEPFEKLEGSEKVIAKGAEGDALTVNWTDLPQKNEAGTEFYTYKIAEVDIDGFETEITGTAKDGYIVKNTDGRIDVPVLKVDKGDGTTPLSGAEFTLYKMKGTQYQKYLTEAFPESPYAAASDCVFTSNGSGTLTITGLSDGDYWLDESKAPAGYITKGEKIYFSVANGMVTLTQGAGTASYEKVNATDTGKTLIIKNEPGAALPNTGGPGTRLFTILGSILILEAGVLLLKRRKLI